MKTLTKSPLIVTKPRPAMPGVLTKAGVAAVEPLLSKVRQQATALSYLLDEFGITMRTLPAADLAQIEAAANDVATMAGALAGHRDRLATLVREAKQA